MGGRGGYRGGAGGGYGGRGRGGILPSHSSNLSPFSHFGGRGGSRPPLLNSMRPGFNGGGGVDSFIRAPVDRRNVYPGARHPLIQHTPSSMQYNGASYQHRIVHSNSMHSQRDDGYADDYAVYDDYTRL